MTLNSVLNICSPMVLNLLFNFLEMAFRAVLRKGFLVLIKALLIFLFCFPSSSIANGILVLGLKVFFRKSFIDVQKRFSKNSGCIVNNIDRISVFKRYEIKNLIL